MYKRYSWYVTFTLRFLPFYNLHLLAWGGLLDIATAQYFYKVYKTILHKPKANSGINIIDNKCVYKYYLQLL
jgi:hypothetical protein